MQYEIQEQLKFITSYLKTHSANAGDLSL